MSARERPILFSGAMVSAILAGRKTVTRRVLKPQPAPNSPHDGGTTWVFRADKGLHVPHGSVGHLTVEEKGGLHCPYGQPGDRLRLRETWALVRPAITDGPYVEEWADWEGALPKEHPGKDWVVLYRASYDGADTAEERDFRWRPSIHMPRWASRLTLEVVSVRAERLHALIDLPPEEVLAEGLVREQDGADDDPFRYRYGLPGHLTHRTGWAAFANLWERINGEASWDANPWVWAISFRRVP
ncbi:hypothetical protein Mx9_p45 [Myxococcus phage Mx9]|nr:Orf3 [Myxococcus phage Mx9]WFG54152.1 hypothetical protein Mx9_p45 [Myxococcus phage Mx9]